MDPPVSQDMQILNNVSSKDFGVQSTSSDATGKEPTPFTATFDLEKHPNSALAVDEVCWIMDATAAREVSIILLTSFERYMNAAQWKVTDYLYSSLPSLVSFSFRSKVAFHQGASLAQTLYTCLYVHQLSSPSNSQTPQQTGFASASTDQEPSSSSEPATLPPKELTNLVLSSYLKGLLACHALVWEELCSGNVVEVSSFHSSTSVLLQLPLGSLLPSFLPFDPDPFFSLS